MLDIFISKINSLVLNIARWTLSTNQSINQTKINIPLNLDVTVDFFVPEIVIGLW